MDDTFFDFRAEVPSLGKGKVDTDMFTDEIEEEEYDALNDQTFGSGVLAEDWEEDHEKFAELVDGESSADKSMPDGLATSPSLQEFLLNKSVLRDDPFGDVGNDRFIEQSISQLVLDDDVDDPAIMGMSRTRPLPMPKHMYHNISPPPPAIMESDDIGSPSTNSIWSSTPIMNNSSLKAVGGNAYVTAVLNSFRGLSPPLIDLTSEDPSIVVAAKDAHSMKQPPTPPKLIPNVRTLAELERDLFLESQRRNAPVKPMTLMHEDIERDILLKPRVRTVSEIEREIAGELMSPVAPRVIRPPPGLTNGGMMPPMAASKNKIGGYPMMRPLLHSVTPPLTVRGPGRPIMSPDHMPTGRHSALLGHHVCFPPPVVGSRRPIVPFAVHGPVQPRIPDQRNVRRFTHSGQPLTNQLRPRLQQKRNSWSEPGSFGLQQHAPHYNGYAVRSNDDYYQDFDEYANLMGQREKDWLVRIQLLQLQTDNPYLDDYYYTTFTLKKRNKHFSKDKEPTLVIPERSKSEMKAYQPTQYEGSLGRLQVMSVNCPRKMIDLQAVHHEEGDLETQKVANRELKRFRQLLLEIERLYTIFLETDDLDKKAAALPEEAGNLLFSRKTQIIGKIHTGLVQIDAVVDLLLSNLGIILKKDQHDPVMPHLWPEVCGSLQMCDFTRIVELGLRMLNQSADINVRMPPAPHRNYLPAILSHKVGLSVLGDVTRRADELHQKGDGVQDNDLRGTWSSILLHIVDTLCSIPEALLPKSVSSLGHFVGHLRRFCVDEAKADSIEHKIKLMNDSSQGSSVAT